MLQTRFLIIPLTLLLSGLTTKASGADFYFKCAPIEQKLTKAFCSAMAAKLANTPQHRIVDEPDTAVELAFETQVSKEEIQYIVREMVGPEIAEEYREAQPKGENPGPAIDRLIRRLTDRQQRAQSEYDQDSRQAEDEPALQEEDPASQQAAARYPEGSDDGEQMGVREGPFFALGAFKTRGLGTHKNQTQYSLGLLRTRQLWAFMVRLQLAHDTGSPLTNYAAIDLGGGIHWGFAKSLFVQGTVHVGYGVVQRYRLPSEVDFDPLIGYTEEIDADRGTTLAARFGFGASFDNIDLSFVTSVNSFTEKNPGGNFPLFQGFALQVMASVD